MAKKPPKYDYLLDADDEGQFCVIPVGRSGKCFAKIDPEDFADIAQFYWQGWTRGQGRGPEYANRTLPKINGKARKQNMQHRVMKLPDDVLLDHKNGDGLDNRKQNLRVADKSQNNWNQKIRTGGSSKYKGVNWNKTCRKWNAQLVYKKRLISLGRFKSEIIDGIDTGELKAARAYDNGAIKYFGSFARLNFPEERNIVTLNDGVYKMSYIMSEQDKKNIENKIQDLKGQNRDFIFEVLVNKTIKDLQDLCHYYGCGIDELVSKIRKGPIKDEVQPFVAVRG